MRDIEVFLQEFIKTLLFEPESMIKWKIQDFLKNNPGFTANYVYKSVMDRKELEVSFYSLSEKKYYTFELIYYSQESDLAQGSDPRDFNPLP